MFETLAAAVTFLHLLCSCPGQPKNAGLGPGTAAEAQEFAFTWNVWTMSKYTCFIYRSLRTLASQHLTVSSDSVLFSTAAMSGFGEQRSCAASLF